jgi:thiamine-monophosphate kinase
MGPGREFDLVRAMLLRWGEAAQGLGDDGAILDVPAGERLVVSTDSSVEHVHFRREWMSPAEIGYRAATAALSDLAAMAARPLGMLVAISTPVSWLDDIPGVADGVGEAASSQGCPIVGGDLSRSSELVLAVTVLGSAIAPARRSAVVAGDSIYVTGTLGGSALALEALERGESPDPEHWMRFAHPPARIREAQWLAANGAHAMIDISDGLASELGHLAAASGVELRIDAGRIPVVRGSTARGAATSSEEYELIVTSPVALDVAAFEREFGLRLTAIGRAHDADRPAVLAFRDDVRVDLGLGHDHFTS